MEKVALFIRHRAKPGCRQEVLRVWEKHVKPRVDANPAHEAYWFCHDDDDPDIVQIFQLYSDRISLTAFMAGEWYTSYLEEVTEFVETAPQIRTATPVWTKR